MSDVATSIFGSFRLPARVRRRRTCRPERFARYCGPAVLAKALGISRLSAAKKLQAAGANGPGCSHQPMREALARAGRVARMERGLGRPTLTQWRRKNKGAHAIVATRSHWIYIRNGRVLEHNGRKSARGRLVLVLWLESDPRKGEGA